jgi:3-methyladenine DNA glycosylase AlkC
MLLKELYSPQFYRQFSEVLATVFPNLDRKKFMNAIFCKEWEQLELKQRMKHTSTVLHSVLPSDYKKTAKLLKELVDVLQKSVLHRHSLELLFIPDYVEHYGIDHFELSVKLLEQITPLSSCEFAVRPFIMKYPEPMLKQMLAWASHKNEHVRRLASEGARPRLPWAMALPALKKDPSPLLPILEKLKNDPSEYVRRSVANNLNDITKDHPQILLDIAKHWIAKSKETDAILKHACRTLLKQGNTTALQLFGIVHNYKIFLQDFSLHKNKISVGEYLSFEISLENTDKKSQDLRIEYAIYYLRQNNTHNKKVFKISERTIEAGEVLQIQRKQSFKIITTRKFYKGTQYISIIVNGKELDKQSFTLA